MSFLPTLLNPALIWLLPLAAIPVLLHLLTLQRLRTVELSTYRFLFDSYIQQRRKMQFLQALLAFLRTLFLLILVLVVCRPVFRNWGGLFQSGSGREVVLLVDCSASMNAQSKGQSSFERAKEAAKLVVGRLNTEDRVTLVRVAGRPEEVFSRFTTDVNSIQERIDNLTTSPSRANLFAALNSIFGPDAKRPSNPLVYFFTDAQSSSWKEIDRQKEAADRFMPSDTPFVVVQVGSGTAGTNLAVTGQAPSRQRAVIGLPVALRAKVVNYSTTETEATLRLFINDKEIPEQRSTFKLKAGEEKIHKFAAFEPSEPGAVQGRFEVSLAGTGIDAFPDDDRFLFTLSVLPKIRVLVVNGNPSLDPYENEGLYIRAALAADKPAPMNPMPMAVNPTRELAKSLDVVDLPETSVTPDALKEASVVILANCGQLNASHFLMLRDFVSEGGGLMIFPGDKINPTVYNDQFFPIPPPQADLLTPVRFSPPVGTLEDSQTFVKLARINFDHPILNIFEQPDNPETRYFDRVYVKRRFPITMKDPKGSAVLFELPDRTPALVQSRYGDGVVFVSAFPLNVKWSNLPTSGAEFVPLMLRMVTYAQRRSEAEGPLVVPADGAAEFSISGTWAPLTGKVTDAADRKIDLGFERAGTRYVGVFDQTSDRGYYTAEIRSDRDHPTSLATEIIGSSDNTCNEILDAFNVALEAEGVKVGDRDRKFTGGILELDAAREFVNQRVKSKSTNRAESNAVKQTKPRPVVKKLQQTQRF